MNYHDIFVKTSYNASNIAMLEKYMFFYLPEVEPKVSNEDCLETSRKISTEKMEKISNADSLFWIMYIHLHSREQYDQLTKYTNVQMNEKRKYADFFMKTPNAMKNGNWKFTKNDIKGHVSDFMTNNDITIDSLHALAVFYKRKIIICNDTVYYEIIPDDIDESLDIIVIYKRDKHFYYIDNPEISTIKSRFLLAKHDMPLKPISSYKVDELRDISRTLGLRPEKNDKQSHYIEIIRNCML